MSTRRLIVAALVCMLAILLAGGFFLFSTATKQRELREGALVVHPPTFGLSDTNDSVGLGRYDIAV